MDLPRLKDICTGMGGLSYGYVQAGYEVDKGIDTWEVALKTYNKYIGKGVHQDLADYYPTRCDYDVIVARARAVEYAETYASPFRENNKVKIYRIPKIGRLTYNLIFATKFDTPKYGLEKWFS